MLRIRAIRFALLALIAGAAALHAVSQGRIYGTIKDENGKPLADVKVTVTLEGLPSFKLEEASNARGDFAVTLIDATKTYTYTLEKEGFQTLIEQIKIPMGSNERHDFQLLSLDEARRRGPTGAELSSADKAVVLYNEGAEASQQGDVETARAKFREAIALDPKLAPAYSALATIAFTEQKWAEAAELAETAHGLDAKDTKSLRVMVQAYHELGDDAKSQAAAAALTLVDPKAGATDIYNQGIREYNNGNSAAAQGLFEQVVALDADYAKAHYMLGLCLAASDAAKARGHLETFLRLAPEDPDAPTAREMLQYLQ